MADLDPVRGREQAGRRPVLVVASDAYLEVVDTLTVVVPVTSVDRGWPNHVPLDGAHGARPAQLGHDRAAAHRRPASSRADRRSRGRGHAAAVDQWPWDFLGL